MASQGLRRLFLTSLTTSVVNTGKAQPQRQGGFKPWDGCSWLPAAFPEVKGVILSACFFVTEKG